MRRQAPTRHASGTGQKERRQAYAKEQGQPLRKEPHRRRSTSTPAAQEAGIYVEYGNVQDTPIQGMPTRAAVRHRPLQRSRTEGMVTAGSPPEARRKPVATHGEAETARRISPAENSSRVNLMSETPRDRSGMHAAARRVKRATRGRNDSMRRLPKSFDVPSWSSGSAQKERSRVHVRTSHSSRQVASSSKHSPGRTTVSVSPLWFRLLRQLLEAPSTDRPTDRQVVVASASTRLSPSCFRRCRNEEEDEGASPSRG